MICSRQQSDTLTITATLKIGAWSEIPVCQIQVYQILLWLTSRCGPQFFPIPIGVFAIGLKIFFGYSLTVWQSRETIAGPTHNPSPVQHFLVLILIPVRAVPYVWLHIDHVDQPLHRPCGPLSVAIDLKLYFYTHFLFMKITFCQVDILFVDVCLLFSNRLRISDTLLEQGFLPFSPACPWTAVDYMIVLKKIHILRLVLNGYLFSTLKLFWKNAIKLFS